MKFENLSFLIVDDDAQTRQVVHDYLSYLGAKDFFEAKDGQTAYKILEKEHKNIDVIICDWEMPKMNGLGLLRLCKQSPTLRNKPFLMITSATEQEQLKIAMAAGSNVDGYLMKPFRANALKDKIIEILSKYELCDVSNILYVEAVESHFKETIATLEELGYMNVHHEEDVGKAVKILRNYEDFKTNLVICNWLVGESSGALITNEIARIPFESRPVLIMVNDPNKQISNELLTSTDHYKYSETMFYSLKQADLKKRIAELKDEKNRKINAIKMQEKVREMIRADKLDIAEKLLTKILSENRGDIKSMILLGDIYMKGGNYSKAISTYQNAIKLEGANADLYCKLARTYAKINDIDKGIALLENAIEKFDKDPYLMFEVSKFYVIKNVFLKAVVYLEQIPSDDPRYKDIAEKSEKIIEALKTIQPMFHIDN